MPDRRSVLLSSLGLAAGLLVRGRTARAEHYEPTMNDAGLYEQPFFIESFLDLAEDLGMARDQGKRFAVMWELKGCPYCKETHLVNFADHEIRRFVSENFAILQLNIIGSRRVTDFDGEVLSEKRLARKWGVRFTPTTNFFPADPGDARGQPGDEAEVARMPGYFEPPEFLAMYRFVAERAYRDTDFRSYLKQTTS
ncbi:MAG: thioredoxin family protein [Halofilum sp. (in: g-proteobacteria)]|nr:thioredoxin family protein [Halofilum sp. (in: g-proteobacteria)]